MSTKPHAKAARTKRNPELSRERILRAALAEFSANGFAGARVDAIAQAARINKRMLYHYYGNKEDLFRAVLRHKISERKSTVAGAPENPLDALPQWSELMNKDPEWMRLLQWEALQWGNDKVVDEEPRKKSVVEVLNRFKAMQQSGTIPADLDAGHLLLSLLAITAYPFAFPPITRLITGRRPSDPEFNRDRAEFLRRFAAYFH
jgi:AcrR family transcriptional regulator